MTLLNRTIESFYYKSSNILADLGKKEQAKLYANAEVRKLKKGRVLYHEGDTPQGIYIVKEGRLKNYINGSQGKEHIFHICCKGDIIGHHALIAGGLYSNSISTIEDSVILFIQKEKFLSLLDSSPMLSGGLMKSWAREFGVFVNRMTILAQMTVRERLALLLLVLHEKFCDNIIDGEVHIVFSRKDLANLVGTAQETAIRLVHDFKEEQLIRTDEKSIIVINNSSLKKIANIKTSNEGVTLYN